MTLSGKKVRQLRDLYKISQEDLACEINISRWLISKIESDKLDGIRLCTAYKIARFFNTTIDNLME